MALRVEGLSVDYGATVWLKVSDVMSSVGMRYGLTRWLIISYTVVGCFFTLALLDCRVSHPILVIMVLLNYLFVGSRYKRIWPLCNVSFQVG